MNPDNLESALIQCMLDRAPPDSESPVSDGLYNALWRKLQQAGWRPTTPVRQGRRPTTNDRALLGEFLAGDASAFEELVRRHLGALVGYARRSLNQEDAEDVAQEAVAVLLRKADQVKPESTVRGFLFGALRLEIRKHLARKSRNEIPTETPAESAEGADHDDDSVERLVEQLDDAQRIARLAPALEEVCNPLEQDVILFALEGHGGPAIARKLGITSNHARQLKRRAVIKLRDHLAGNPLDEPPGNP